MNELPIENLGNIAAAGVKLRLCEGQWVAAKDLNPELFQKFLYLTLFLTPLLPFLLFGRKRATVFIQLCVCRERFMGFLYYFSNFL